MRRFFSAFCIFSLAATPAWSQQPMSNGKKTDRVADFITKRKSRALPELQSCRGGVADNELISSFAKNSFEPVHEKLICSYPGENFSDLKLDLDAIKKLNLDTCKKIAKCHFMEGNKTVNIYEKNDLIAEAATFITRETTEEEMNKYHSRESEAARGLLDYVHTMLPKEYRSKVAKCSQASSPSENVCNANTKQTSQIHQIMEMSHQHRTNEEIQNSAPKSELQLARIQKYHEQQASSKEGSIVDQLKELEDLNQESRPVDTDKDEVISGIYEDIAKKIEGNSSISPNEIKKMVKQSLLRMSKEGHDDLLKYKNENNSGAIDQVLSNIDFNGDDFGRDKKSLANKINDLRVALVSHYLSEDCSKTNVSIDNVCSNITNKLKTGGALEILKKNEADPLKKLIDYYQASNIPEKDEKIQQFEKMRKSKDHEKYFIYSLKRELCAETFPDDIVSPADADREISKIVDQKIFAQQNDYRISRGQTQKALDNFFSSSGTSKGPLDVKAAANLSKPNDASAGGIVKADSSAMSASSVNAPITQKVATNAGESFDPSVYDPATEAKASVASKTGSETGAADIKQQMARLADLENKEKALSKNVATSGDSRDSNEISSLQREIADLKKTMARNSTAKQGAGVDAPKGASRNLPGAAYGDSGNQGRYASTSGDNLNAVTSDRYDYSGQGSSNAAIHAPAPQGASGAVGNGAKATNEKAMAGIVLTKTGEVVQDQTSIIDNPKEGDIISLLEQTKGQPFLIRENGVLIKVSALLDASGKPQLGADGKPLFKKETLSKKEREIFAQKATIAPRLLKEVGESPTRLYNLKSLLNKTLQREEQ